MKSVRNFCVRLILAAALLAGLAGAPAASASQPGDTEHGVNRDKLMAKAERIVEERNGIDVLKISKCGPQKRKGKLNYSVWICLWRADGTWADTDVDYACAGRAVYKRKSKTWIVDRCENQRQPMAPLLQTPNPPPIFGFNDDWLFQSTAAFNLLEDSGAEIARTNLPWSGIEPTPGKFDWKAPDALYQNLLSRGIRPLWVLLGVPCRFQADPAACAAGADELHPAPQYYDEFAEFAALAAKRYPEAIGFEVWNEPNYPKYWGGPPDVALYADMLKTVADEIHAEAPGTTVVSAGLSPHSDTDESGSVGFHEFLNELYERGAAQQADVIGIHPYPGVGPGEDYLTDVRVYLGKVQNVMDRFGDSDTPVWATEFGVSTAGDKAFSEQAQGQAITDLLLMFQRIRNFDMAIVHSLIEPARAGREGGFGVLNRNLTPKPAFCDLAAVRGVSIDIC